MSDASKNAREYLERTREEYAAWDRKDRSEQMDQHRRHLVAVLAELAALDRGVHSCHAACSRPACVLRRERDGAIARADLLALAAEGADLELAAERDAALAAQQRAEAERDKHYAAAFEMSADLERERDRTKQARRERDEARAQRDARIRRSGEYATEAASRGGARDGRRNVTIFLCSKCGDTHNSAAIPRRCAAVAVLDMDDLAGHCELIREHARDNPGLAPNKRKKPDELAALRADLARLHECAGIAQANMATMLAENERLRKVADAARDVDAAWFAYAHGDAPTMHALDRAIECLHAVLAALDTKEPTR